MTGKTESASIQHDARDRLMEAALDQFTRRGYASTTVRELCQAAGVTKPVLYYYFKNKEGLYLELMAGSYTLLESILSQLTAFEGSPAERLVHFCEGLFDICVENKSLVRLMFSIYFGPPQGAPFYDIDRYYDRILEVIGAIIQAGMDGGEIRKGDLADMSWIILSCLNAAIEEQLCLTEPRIERPFMGRMVKMLMGGIGARNT